MRRFGVTAALAMAVLAVLGGPALAQQTASPCLPGQTPAARCTYLPLMSNLAATLAPPTQAPTATPPTMGTPTATATPTASPTPSPSPTPSTTAVATSTPAPPPPSYNNCASDPNAGSAPNYPVRISGLNKVGETVTIQNLSGSAMSIVGWRICSITGNQLHATLSGQLGAGETRVITSQASGYIWNNSVRDDAALYDAQGRLISYWVD